MPSFNWNVGGRKTSSNNSASTGRTLYEKDYAIVDQNVDEQWGSYFSGDGADNTYFDYFFSGQDFKVYIDGADDFDLPIVNIGWSISQQKMMIYGYNSWTYDAVARGQRIVNGTFSIYFKSPQYLMQAISQAAKTRSTNKGILVDDYYRDLTPDDANIEKYWNNNLDPSLANEGINLFSSSPPFSLVILYGVQDTSTYVLPTGSTRDQIDATAYWQNYGSNDTLLFDTNSRLVAPNTLLQKMVIDSVELMNMQVTIDGTGQPIIETYSFTARDYYVPNIQS